MTKKFEINNQSYDIWQNKKGYPCISVREGKKDKAYLLHRIVYETQNGPIPDGHDIHHVDGDKGNWSPGNLKAMDREAHRELHRQSRSTKKDNKAGMNMVRNTNQKHPENTP